MYMVSGYDKILRRLGLYFQEEIFIPGLCNKKSYIRKSILQDFLQPTHLPYSNIYLEYCITYLEWIGAKM